VGLEIGTSKGVVSRWETGERTPSRYYQEQLCKLFGRSAQELGFLDASPDESSSVLSLQEGLPVPTSSASQARMTTIPERKGDALGFSRRQVLQGMLDAACTTLVLAPYAMLNADAIDRLTAVVTRQMNIDDDLLDDLHTVTRHHWKLSTNLSVEVLSSITGHFQTVIHLLKRSHPTSVAQRLSSLASEAAQIIGKVLFDVHEYELAWSYYAFALQAAQSAQNRLLYAAGLGRMSLLAIRNDQPQEALSLLEYGQTLPLQNHRMRAWHRVIEAEASAHLDNVDAFTRAMEEAERIARESSLEEDLYATGFNLSRLAGYKGSCYLRLNQAEAALNALQQADALRTPFYIRRKAVILAHMGTAYAKMGEVKEAYDCACQSLTIIAQIGSLDTFQRVQALRAALPVGSEQALVTDLDQQMQLVQHHITAVPIRPIV
jgi:tetratricopeptide (TPR) repeat protein/transcriptional regulator with XRE-family HTH domain